jgi:hypothetical protein
LESIIDVVRLADHLREREASLSAVTSSYAMAKEESWILTCGENQAFDAFAQCHRAAGWHKPTSHSVIDQFRKPAYV